MEGLKTDESSSGSNVREPLIRDLTPADRRSADEVAEYELRSLPEQRKVYLQHGALFFLSSKHKALRALRSQASQGQSKAVGEVGEEQMSGGAGPPDSGPVTGISALDKME
mmetsp:Transcript_80752/g.187470  ORF Transcript_80752/g.187470 Transcript_80752/m.187470 type:complete len:111 (+) Transcript_80752:54-386(+)|eukprot:CAMPEP_0171106888 /NCGR_PEP_ID=MMETSP0766_2-20121228/65756_1 /TAXON_ID=439317 /ORGANISM="Gambierdiscus australes, Strain CAWD 149" /LENGTH=110 /DNA_ID=CAMNT_0011568095 /DNA_START=44 /DNA_END=376 /DNA_ORIENTATION=-